jgi:hypothetical protein
MAKSSGECRTIQLDFWERVNRKASLIRHLNLNATSANKHLHFVYPPELNRRSLQPTFCLKTQQESPAEPDFPAAFIACISGKCRRIFLRCRLPRLAVLMAGFAVGFPLVVPAHASDKLWACLLFASDEKMGRDVPTWLKNYNERLEKLVGYTGLRSLGQGEVTLQPDKPAVVNLKGNMRIQLSSWVREGGGRFLVNIKFYRRDRSLIETQARMSRGSPLFFRGPLWRNGRLIVAVVIGQRTGWDIWDPWGD